jgi:hypothetical protein
MCAECCILTAAVQLSAAAVVLASSASATPVDIRDRKYFLGECRFGAQPFDLPIEASVATRLGAPELENLHHKDSGEGTK